jgi:hypothetical protein
MTAQSVNVVWVVSKLCCETGRSLTQGHLTSERDILIVETVCVVQLVEHGCFTERITSKDLRLVKTECRWFCFTDVCRWGFVSYIISLSYARP